MQTTLLGVAIAIILALAGGASGTRIDRLVTVSRPIRDALGPDYRSGISHQRSHRCPPPAYSHGDAARHRVRSQTAARCGPALARRICSGPLDARGMAYRRRLARGTRVRNRIWTRTAAFSGRSRRTALRPEGPFNSAARHHRWPATFANAAGGSRLTLDNLEFTGAFRSMFGPVKGDGTFVAAGHRYPFQISLSRIAEGGAPNYTSTSSGARDR